ncbi:SDR family oxidoreductase, partial [Novosphingobium sp. Chol11]
EKRILLGRMGEAEEIGRVVRFLLSDEASYITAAQIVVDGGNISSQR